MSTLTRKKCGYIVVVTRLATAMRFCSEAGLVNGYNGATVFESRATARRVSTKALRYWSNMNGHAEDRYNVIAVTWHPKPKRASGKPKKAARSTTKPQKVRLTHVVDAQRGGRFGEDVVSVRCRFCGRVWTDEEQFSRLRIGDKPCPKRKAKS